MKKYLMFMALPMVVGCSQTDSEPFVEASPSPVVIEAGGAAGLDSELEEMLPNHPLNALDVHSLELWGETMCHHLSTGHSVESLAQGETSWMGYEEAYVGISLASFHMCPELTIG